MATTMARCLARLSASPASTCPTASTRRITAVFLSRRTIANVVTRTIGSENLKSPFDSCYNMQRRTHSTESGKREPKADAKPANGTHDVHKHEHEHAHDGHGHTHSHSIFGGHTHSADEAHNQGAEIIAALQGKGDRGSNITLLGLLSNVALTGIKGAAGWWLHSASLLADAGHSMSDLLGDFVVLICWNLSRRPPSARYPYGFAKFETIGSATISLLLIGGALGIGFHSYHLLLHALTETAASMPSGPLQEALHNVTTIAPVPEMLAQHGHTHAVDPNAAWVALLSVAVKEGMYRLTRRVADQEKSPVLLANAYHHRSDAYSSGVALLAILGTTWFPALPLDPIGGLLVSFVVARQGLSVLFGCWTDLTDASVSDSTKTSLAKLLNPLVDSTEDLFAIRSVRARHAGSMIYVDLVADVRSTLSVVQTSELENTISSTLKDARKEIAEVRVQFHPRDI